MGEEVGPVSAGKLKEAADRGELLYDSQVRQLPDGNWVPAERIKGLFGASQVTPPSLPESIIAPPTEVADQWVVSFTPKMLVAIVIGQLVLFVFLGWWMTSGESSAETIEKAKEATDPKFNVLTVRSIEFADENGNMAGRIFSGGGGMHLMFGVGEGLFIHTGGDPSMRIVGVDGETYFSSTKMALRPYDAREKRDYDALNERASEDGWDSLTKQEQDILRAMSYEKNAVSIYAQNGGSIDIYNPFEKVVVRVQSNKGNEGAVYVGDVNGKIQRTLAP